MIGPAATSKFPPWLCRVRPHWSHKTVNLPYSMWHCSRRYKFMQKKTLNSNNNESHIIWHIGRRGVQVARPRKEVCGPWLCVQRRGVGSWQERNHQAGHRQEEAIRMWTFGLSTVYSLIIICLCNYFRVRWCDGWRWTSVKRSAPGFTWRHCACLLSLCSGTFFFFLWVYLFGCVANGFVA